MAKYTAKRVVMALLTLLVVACITFFLMNAIPGNPWLSEKTPSQATIDALNAKYGLVATILLHTLCGGIEGLKIFPTIFDGTLKSYVLPCAALGFYPMCYLSRQTRTAMLDSINQEYIKTARAKGLKNKKIIFKHALRNALIPVITYLGPQIAFTLCGGLVVEKVFSIPGLGRYFIQSIQNRDYPVIMGTTIFLAAFIIVMNLLVDLAYKLVDPRINLSKGGN